MAKTFQCGPRSAGAVLIALVALVGSAADIHAAGLGQAGPKLIDTEINKALAENNIKLSSQADDAEFLRRAYLDITGIVPTAEQVEAFLKRTEADKRARVIDELLASPRFGKYWAELWTNLTIPTDSNNRRLDTTSYESWLTENFNANKPLDKMVYELLTATGEMDKNGAVSYFVANASPDKMTDNVTQMFLGVKLQCAQCHNHPFVEWKQDEYWGMAAFFMKVRTNGNPNQAAKKGIVLAVSESTTGGRRGGLPESAKIVPPQFLQAEKPEINPKEPYRPVLAKWIASAENPYFARAMVNRVWHQMFGRGLVNPVDDMHEGHPPTHPALLEQLTAEFKASGFDMKELIRAIANSEAYQRTSRTMHGNEADTELYSHAFMRVLSAEQLYDSLEQILGRERVADRGPRVRVGNNVGRAAFVKFFRTVENADAADYQAGIPQALRLMNSPQTNGSAVLNKMMEEGTPEKIVQKLYLTILSRPASEPEVARMTEFVAQQANPRMGYSDVLWALVNSSEFALNH
jgi:hypothetical protein